MDIPTELHRALKVRAAREGTTVTAIVMAALSIQGAPAQDAAPPTPTRARAEEQGTGPVARLLEARKP